jgi:hypothetical protein
MAMKRCVEDEIERQLICNPDLDCGETVRNVTVRSRVFQEVPQKGEI